MIQLMFIFNCHIILYVRFVLVLWNENYLRVDDWASR